MYCIKCGNDFNFRINNTSKTVACKNVNCNNIIRTKNNFDFIGVDEIAWFSHHMLQTLNPESTIRPSWDKMPFERLYFMLRERLQMLEAEYNRQKKTLGCDSQAILTECCEIANLCMKIADNICVTKNRKYYGE